MLAKLKPKKKGEQPGWIFFKEHDPSVDTESDILAARPESVKSGKRIEELVAAKPAAKATVKPQKLEPSKLKGAVKAAMPKSVKLQLATPAEDPPSGDDWLHEIKLDGYRTMAFVDAGKVRLITRGGLDWSEKYAELTRAFETLPVQQAVIDGEIVVVDDAGMTHFSLLQEALSAGDSGRLTFFAFDLVYLDGYDLTKVPLIERKAMLAKMLAPVITANSAIHYSDHVLGDGAALYHQAGELGLEGIVSKKVSAPYLQMRSATWLKVKAPKVGDFPVVGYTLSPAAAGIGALALGQWRDGELHYCGKVGTGFVASDLTSIERKLKPLASEEQRLDRMPADVIPVRPVLQAHVHFAGLTRDGSVRHAVFHGLREPEMTAAPSTAAPRKRYVTDADLAGISITNPTRRLFGKAGPTKLDLAVYYAQVGDYILPHIIGRPVSLVRSPSGSITDLFFQRHPFGGMPKSLATFEIKRSDGEDKRYISVEDAKGYLALAQFGVIEFHIWGCHRQTIEKPDILVFDLDPGEGITWRNVVAAAKYVREALKGIGLEPFLKTSGGRGAHVVVPIMPKLDWKKAHAFTSLVANTITKSAPDTFTAIMGKDNRKRRIFIDFHRNARSATAAAAYSLRARTNLPASAPLNWSDVDSIDAPEDLNYSTLPGFLTRTGDPWADMDAAAREIPASFK